MGAGVPQSAPSSRPGGPTPQQSYDVVAVSLRQGLEAMDILRLRGRCGSVLPSPGGTRLLFVVPAGTAEDWQLPGSSCAPGTLGPAAAADPGWPAAPAGPDGPLRPTDPWALRSALCEAACTLTAGGLGPF